MTTRRSLSRKQGSPSRIHGSPSRIHAGFTLVELLVVIGIIALLISILLPSLGRARQQANVVACMSNLRNIGQAMIQYTNDNKGSLPIAWRGGGGPNDPNDVWSELLYKYLGGRDRTSPMPMVMVDKDMKEATAYASWYDGNRLQGYTMHGLLGSYDPAHSEPRIRKPQILSKLRDPGSRVVIWDAPQVGNAWGGAADLQGVNQPFANCWMMGDTESWGPYWLDWPLPNWYTDPRPGPNPGANTDPADRAMPFRGASGENDYVFQIRWRHQMNTVANFLFLDGHVDSMRYKRRAYGGSELQWSHIWVLGR
jgi:prepilin-type N-terminal cleavage/methylation domain-containing protein/prepilin-type processing-associated H-X9-DG protein